MDVLIAQGRFKPTQSLIHMSHAHVMVELRLVGIYSLDFICVFDNKAVNVLRCGLLGGF